MQRRLGEAMREWVAADKADDYLFRGGLLEQVAKWAATTEIQLSGPERALLAASIGERDREEEEPSTVSNERSWRSAANNSADGNF